MLIFVGNGQLQGPGMVGGIGVDLVDIERLSVALRRTESFAEEVFTSNERTHCAGCRRPVEHLATCFAAKEAFLKAVGVGLWGGIPLQQVEVVHGASGQPRLELGTLALSALHRRGCRSSLLAVSHGRGTAAAVVVVQ